MISGATYLILFDFPAGVTGIDKIIFTFACKGQTVTKAYPTTVTYSNGKLLVPLTQEDTLKLAGFVDIEAQVNYTDKSVAKKRFRPMFLSPTLATETVTGNTPSGGADLEHIKFELDGDVIIAKIEGEIDPEDIAEAVADYLEEHPVTPTWGSITGTLASQADLQAALAGKVNTVAGKGLSSNDYTNEDKAKVGQALTEHQSLKTINNQSLVGTGTISINGVPAFTAADNGKVLGVVNGALAWVTGSSPAPAPTTKTLASISATKTTTTYNTGDTIGTSDITVTATYSDSTTATVTGWTTNAGSIDMTTAGSKTLTISYTEDGVTKTASVTLTVEEAEPGVPQTGTWQLKTTTNKKYVILGTDDDNNGNAAFFRLLRTYDFPYTMNIEAENLTKSIGNDQNENFTEQDAPSIFSDGATVTTLAQYLNTSGKGEVALHGSSDKTLWDSANLTGANWTTLYNSYTSQGGSKTESELKAAIATELADTNGSNDAPYVMRSRNAIEAALGFGIKTVGIWGGAPECTIDGITLNLNAFKGTSNYGWRTHNFWAVGSRLGSVAPNTSTYDISRLTDSPANDYAKLANINPGNAVEFFWHHPFGDHAFSGYRTFFSQLAADTNIEVVTRYQYSQLGEFVANPITSITLTPSKSTFSTSETITAADFTCTATFQDGTTSACAADKILDLAGITAGTAGTYTARLLYRGFSATSTISVVSGSFTLPEFIQSATSGDYQMIRGTDDQDFACLVYFDAAAGGFSSSAYVYNHAYVWKPTTRPSTLRIFMTYDGSDTWVDVYNNAAPAALKSTADTYFGTHTFTAEEKPCTLGEVVHIG